MVAEDDCLGPDPPATSLIVRLVDGLFLASRASLARAECPGARRAGKGDRRTARPPTAGRVNAVPRATAVPGEDDSGRSVCVRVSACDSHPQASSREVGSERRAICHELPVATPIARDEEVIVLTLIASAATSDNPGSPPPARGGDEDVLVGRKNDAARLSAVVGQPDGPVHAARPAHVEAN